MASAIIHICIAKKVNEVIAMDENLLFLGSIAPDISKQIGETKQKSHFIDKDVLDIPNIEKFLGKYKLELRKPFEMGYFIHLLTDYYWYKDFFKEYVFRNESIKFLNNVIIELNEENIKKLVYEDYSNINIDLIDKYEISLDLFSNEIDYPTSIIEEIPINKLNVIVEKMGIIIKNSKEEKTVIFDIKKIEDFINETSVKIIDYIKHLENRQY